MHLREQTFASVFRAGDSRKFGVDLANNRSSILDAAARVAQAGLAAYGPIHTTIVNGRSCNSIKDYSQTLILRVLAKFIAKRFRVELNNRDRAVQGVISALGESTPIYIVRRDIASFYETVPTKELIRKCLHDIFLTATLRHHLDCFFKTFSRNDQSGLPRGICVSPQLAELAMEDFDKQVKRLPGVYKYFRYSDDILILSYLPTQLIETKLPGMLPEGMTFNENKSSSIQLSCREKAKAISVVLEYLGYSYKISNLCGSSDRRKVEVCISESKIKKIKTRIFRCFKAYEKNEDFSLLRDRLQFLSGNYIVRRHGAIAVKSSRFVRSGIFYNYKLCGVYDKAEVKAHSATELKALDGVYQSLIKSGSKIGSRFTDTQYKQLKLISFYKGFELKITTKFSPTRVAELKRAWRNG